MRKERHGTHWQKQEVFKGLYLKYLEQQQTRFIILVLVLQVFLSL